MANRQPGGDGRQEQAGAGVRGHDRPVELGGNRPPDGPHAVGRSPLGVTAREIRRGAPVTASGEDRGEAVPARRGLGGAVPDDEVHSGTVPAFRCRVPAGRSCRPCRHGRTLTGALVPRRAVSSIMCTSSQRIDGGSVFRSDRAPGRSRSGQADTTALQRSTIARYGRTAFRPCPRDRGTLRRPAVRPLRPRMPTRTSCARPRSGASRAAAGSCRTGPRRCSF